MWGGRVDAAARSACRCELTASACARDEAGLEEEGLDDIFEGAGVFVEGGREGFEPDGAAVVGGGEGFEVCAVEGVEAELVDAFEGEGFINDAWVETALGADLGVIADAAEESVGDAGRAA